MSPAGLWHPQVDIDFHEAQKKFTAGENHLPPSEELSAYRSISSVWPEQPPHDHLHIFIRPFHLGVSPNTSSELFYAATKLHQAMWQTNLEKRLLDVDECKELKYLPSSEVKDLQLRVLGCDTDTILIREEYLLTLKELKDCRPKFGGIVLTGQPGIGMI